MGLWVQVVMQDLRSFKSILTIYFQCPCPTIAFDATDTDIDYFTADVTFNATIYNITDLRTKPLIDLEKLQEMWEKKILRLIWITSILSQQTFLVSMRSTLKFTTLSS